MSGKENDQESRELALVKEKATKLRSAIYLQMEFADLPQSKIADLREEIRSPNWGGKIKALESAEAGRALIAELEVESARVAAQIAKLGGESTSVDERISPKKEVNEIGLDRLTRGKEADPTPTPTPTPTAQSEGDLVHPSRYSAPAKIALGVFLAGVAVGAAGGLTYVYGGRSPIFASIAGGVVALAITLMVLTSKLRAKMAIEEIPMPKAAVDKFELF